MPRKYSNLISFNRNENEFVIGDFCVLDEADSVVYRIDDLSYRSNDAGVKPLLYATVTPFYSVTQFVKNIGVAHGLPSSIQANQVIETCNPRLIAVSNVQSKCSPPNVAYLYSDNKFLPKNTHQSRTVELCYPEINEGTYVEIVAICV